MGGGGSGAVAAQAAATLPIDTTTTTTTTTVGIIYDPPKAAKSLANYRFVNRHHHHHQLQLLVRRMIRKGASRLGLGLGLGNLGTVIKIRMLVSASILLVFLLLFAQWFGPSLMGWTNHLHPPSSSSRGGYTVLINTWKRNSLLKKAVTHYATCSRTEAIRVVWSENDPPPYSLKAYLTKITSQTSHRPNFRFELNTEDNLNNRFKPIEDLGNDAIFSVDDDVIVPCTTLNNAFSVWQTSPDTMVGFVPRMHWLDQQKDGVAYYKYGGWWSVWWMGTYSMILSKAAFFHRKYLDMYTYTMPPSIRDYVTRERNCEDIAMSLLVANATGAPPIWVKGKIYEIGSHGISTLQGHTERRDKCLNDFITLYGAVPLVATNMKAVNARGQWLW